ncbi:MULTISPECIES: hypothetical protein [Streptomyces]|uniref:Uncharacterized protein n=1 Tax=Streptomyces virginiae TaxID=1961 RepID=A0ABQ3NPI4_STRVG|nr:MULTISPECIES: hypothetical protein [Streptomyces]KOU78311.1 hypothetical protein ADK94_34820 [Streptomyces sp. XY593]KOV06709.1 hypothetical protein ADK92_06330 [Streptomyces sp. XY533]MBP2341475.1 uncharacterized protein YecA (UPF0149 family) [Streptomyces virginiae]MCI4079198.1 hypothetical protein [Streptomyces sp. MMS21 TC-5]GGQ06582.1 hypothetical protein GCM10010215_34790 [Streptomyces virginiae]
MTQDTATNEPHEPTPEERAARDRVRRRAEGMTHHQTADALEAAEEAAGDLDTVDTGTRAEVAEWRRITDLLFDHGGPYAPETDAFVQGQLTARKNHRDTP